MDGLVNFLEQPGPQTYKEICTMFKSWVQHHEVNQIWLFLPVLVKTKVVKELESCQAVPEKACGLSANMLEDTSNIYVRVLVYI